MTPAAIEEFRDGVATWSGHRGGAGLRRLNCLVGRRLDDIPEETQTATLVDNLRLRLTRPRLRGYARSWSH